MKVNKNSSIDYIIVLQTLINSRRFISVQKPAPNFEGTAVVDSQFKTINLSDYSGKYLVLFFYPLDL